jgi:integrase
VLNAPALEVLSTLQRVGVYVIAGETAGLEDEKPRADLKRPWAVVRAAAKLEDLRIHDLRHNFGGFGAGGGAGLYIVGKLLGHSPKNPKTTARYSHLDNDPLRKASNSIGSAIAAAMGERRPKPDEDKVIPIHGRKAG